MQIWRHQPSEPSVRWCSGPISSSRRRRTENGSFNELPAARTNVWALSDYRATERRVPGIVTTGPRQHVGEGGEEKAKSPGNDHVVVEVDVEGDQNDGVSYS